MKTVFSQVALETIKEKEILPCMFVSDDKIVMRTWKERLFSIPWTPFKKTKIIQEPVAYVLKDLVIVSHKTYEKLYRDGVIQGKEVKRRLGVRS